MRRSSCASASRRASTWTPPGAACPAQVSVGLAPGTAAAALALPLLRTVRARHPGILLYLNENYGTTLSELIMNGRMDLAVLYGDKAIHGLTLPAAAEGAAVPGGPGVACRRRPQPVPLADAARDGSVPAAPLQRGAQAGRRGLQRGRHGAARGGRDRIGLHADRRRSPTAWARPSCRPRWRARWWRPAAPGSAASSSR